MPKPFLYDFSNIDLTCILHDRCAIRAVNPQRGHFEQLDAIVYACPEQRRLLGYKDVLANEFWADGHVPGRPLLPGVMMIESAAQLAAFYLKQYCGWGGFVGFGGVNDVHFRRPVTPGQRLFLLLQQTRTRLGRSTGNVQGIVDGQIVFDAEVIGVML